MVTQNSINNEVRDNDFLVNRDLAGAPTVATIRHTDNTNPASDSRILQQVGGTAAGSVMHGFEVPGGDSWTIGVDNGDSDNLKIAESLFTLATNTSIICHTGGPVTKPRQPAFRAGLSAPTTNDVTGDNTNYTIIFDTETYDVNADYNNATGLFTAPVAGVYLFSASALFANLSAGHTLGSLSFFINGASPGFAGNYYNVGVMRDAANNCSVSQTTMFTLAAGATVEVVVASTGSTLTVGVFGSAALQYTWFTGALLF